MKKIIITGGAGDWAQHFKSNHAEQYQIITPNRSELDVCDISSVEHYFKNQDCDILINNAGCIHPERILSSDPEKWINDINVNLIGTYLTTKAVLHKNPKAIIINISSTAAYNAYPDWSSYCASKAGVVTISKAFANDGFDVYCLCPGAINTKFRNYFDLSNDNAMPCESLSNYVIKVLAGEFNSGDVLFIRKNEFHLNP
ncbi:SDR family NAD(P)-dependent oxidoreductase [Thalassotalea ganghwensis]